MTVEFDGMKNFCARAAVIGMVAFGASACSSIPDWVDPTTWIGGGGPSDSETSAGETPDLASIPDRPAPASTADEQQQVASSLAADRSRAKYSADALRGGTEAAAPPPPPAAEASNDLAVPQSNSTASAAPPPASTSGTDVASNDQQPEAAPPADTSSSIDASAAATQAAPPPPPPAATQLPPAESSTANAVAAATPPSGQTTMAMVSPSDAALGFKPSSAPPLDPSIGQFVPPPLIARYDQTASAAGISGARMALAAPARSRRAVGGPEKMTGSVVANLDALQAPSTMAAPAYSASGMTPASVVLFSGDGTLLTAQAKLQVRAAVEQFKRSGGQGYLRIVGHASSRTSNMPLEKHLEVIFNKSQDRANAVAKEVIREGVPANRVLVEAVGDSQPVYYESMPQGEDGNRRAEIYLQS
jgi:outer membrane protein OmpA-like peptidoglycan-associated protein